MIKKKLMLSLFLFFSFSNISCTSLGITPLQCAENDFCPIIIGLGVVVLCFSFSNDYNNYIISQNEKIKSNLFSNINSTNITSNNFGVNCSEKHFFYPVCFLNQTNKNVQKVCQQRSKEELKFLAKQNWDKLSPVAKKRYKYNQRYK